MRETPFQTIREARSREPIREAFNWFKRQIAKLRNVTPAKLLEDESKLVTRIRINPKKMYMFRYDPKTNTYQTKKNDSDEWITPVPNSKADKANRKQYPK